MPALNGEGNVIQTDDIICMEALRLLKNNMVFGRIASKRYQQEFADVGETVNIELPARVRSAEGRALVIQPMVKKTVPLTIEKQFHVGIEYTMRDRTLSLGSFSDKILKSGVVQLANRCDKFIAQTLLDQSFYSSGTAGTIIDEDALIDAHADAELHGMPDDGMLHCVLNPRDAASVQKALKGLYNEQIVKSALRKGELGEIDGINLYRSANAANHTTGTFTSGSTPLVKGADQSGSSLITDGWANSTLVLKKGDVFTLDDVNAIDPQSYESIGDLMQFTATADVTSDSSGNATIPISPAINSGTQTQADALGSNISTKAYQNVDALPANNAPLNPVGTEATAYRYAPIFHQDALAVALPPLRKPETATVAEVMTDEDTGISISLTGGYDPQEHREVYRLDVLLAAEVVYGELVQRLISAAA